MIIQWLFFGEFAVYISDEKGSVGIGIRFSWDEPALDLFFGPLMISFTTRKHAMWVKSCIMAAGDWQAIEKK